MRNDTYRPVRYVEISEDIMRELEPVTYISTS